MATTLTNMVQTLVVGPIQAALKNALVPLNSFSFAPDVVEAVQNSVSRVPVITDATAQSKTPGTSLTENGSAATTAVTLSNFYAAKWALNEAQITAAKAPATFAAFAEGATYSLAKQVLDAACALVTAANYGSTANQDVITVAAADFGQNDLGLLLTAAETKKLGRQRSMILNGSYAGQLIGNSSLGLILATLGEQALKTAMLPPLMGFNSYIYSALPTNSENLGGFVCDKGAIAVATAPPEALWPAGSGDKIADTYVTEPDSGMTVRYVSYGSTGAGTIYGEVQILYGVAVVQNSVVRIVSA